MYPFTKLKLEMYDFLFKPFNEMTPDDYERVGFKGGLEVHQQLDTKKKLFCRCPVPQMPYKGEYHSEILRHMRPTLSELGEYDGTALMEFKTRKEIIYRINRDNICTYEMDDTPPFEINEEALDIALEIGLAMNAKVVDELHIARKQYLDGSIPNGFQRTAIFCINGWIPYKDRKIDIVQMSIEEDSCREVSDSGHTRTYLTDRLGVPLVEIVTAPQMRTPVEIAEVNNIIRKVCQSTGKVRVGIGTARQDVNVSVYGGTRIEIKGVHKINSIPILTYNEAMRQWNLLRLREELHRRGITPETFSAEHYDVTKILKRTSFYPISLAIQEGWVVRCVKLPGWKGLLEWKTQTYTTFAKEISDRVRVIACLTTLPNIIYSDSIYNTISREEIDKVRKHIGASSDDSFVIVWADQRDIETAVDEITIRAREATLGVPSETRQALRDGTTGFERILPGPDRMYPDTDLPPKKITDDRIERIRMNMLKPFWEREKWYRQLGVPEDRIEPLSISPYAQLFEFVVKEWNISPVFSSEVLINLPKKFRRQGFDVSKLNVNIFKELFNEYKNGRILRDGFVLALQDYLKNGELKLERLPKLADQTVVRDMFQKATKELKSVKLHNPEKVKELLIAFVMHGLRGSVEGKFVRDFVQNNWKDGI